MMTFTLKDYVSEIGQVRAGQYLGVTQIAISKALRSGRNIFVQVNEGKVAAFETKAFPAKSKLPIQMLPHSAPEMESKP